MKGTLTLALCLFAMLMPAAEPLSAQQKIDPGQVLDRYKAVWIDGKQDLIDSVFAPDVVRHHPASVRPPDVKGRDAYRAYIAEFRSLHPNLRVEVHEVMADRNTLVYRYTARAFVDPSKSKEFTFTGITMARLDAAGRIAEEWLTWDTYDLMSQVGLVPARQP